MIEDKLDHDERIRLECAALAMRIREIDGPAVLALAKQLERYVRGEA